MMLKQNLGNFYNTIYNHWNKDILKLGGIWSVYIFSLADDTFDEDFAGMEMITVAPIPEAISRVYRRLFQTK